VKKLAALFLLVASTAFAQKPVNPSVVTFTPSPDHAQITTYTIGYFLPGAAEPVQTATDIGKPVPDAQNTCTVPINTQPVPFGLDYVARIKAFAAGIASDWSEPSNFFDRKPGPPSKPVVK